MRIKSVALGSEPLPGVDAMAGGSATRLDDVDVIAGGAVLHEGLPAARPALAETSVATEPERS